MSQNLITPADVGQRVSVQFSLPNGFMSEAVGQLERYDEGAETYFVRTKDDEIIRMPERGIRYGKVVPEPPEPRESRNPGNP